jgi:putative ABC transport system substrate-binding protein
MAPRKNVVMHAVTRLVTGVVLLLAVPLAMGAEQPGKTYRVAYLAAAPRSSNQVLLAQFQQGMRELGYVEGRNLVLETRFAEGQLERLPTLAQELVQLKPDVMFVSTTPGALAAKAATPTIPIVFVAVADPVGSGLISNLARPDGNVTGVTHIVAELTGKRLELLKEIVPSASRIAVLVNPEDPNATAQIRNAEAAARGLGVQLQPMLTVRGASDLERAFEAIPRSGAAAALRMVDPTVDPLRARTVELAARYRLPIMFAFRNDVESGGLVAYGANLPVEFRQAATFVHKILRGARPGDLPIEQPTKFELIINLKTAKALGLTIPPSLLQRADQVIE